MDYDPTKEEPFFLQSYAGAKAAELYREIPRPADSMTWSERLSRAISMAYDYASDDPPAVLLEGYDRIRDCPSFGDLLGLKLRRPIEWPTPWEMIYGYESPKLPRPEGTAVLMDVSKSRALDTPADKVLGGLRSLLAYYDDVPESLWHTLISYMESQVPGSSIITM
jgi:hypothetical protein